MKIHRLLFAVCILLMGVLLAGCVALEPAAPGGSGEEEPAAAVTDGNAAPTVTFTATEYAYEGPESIPSGLTRLELVNNGEREHSLWAIRLDEGKTFEDIMGVFATMETDPQMPEWLTWYGGVNAGPGATSAYTIDLAPGSYTLLSFGEDEEGVPDALRGLQTTLIVTEAEDNGATPPVADLRMELVDFSFVIDGEPKSGPQIVEFTNTGMEAHEMALFKLEEGVTIENILDFMMAEDEAAGPPPFAFLGGAAPMDPGMTAWYEVDLDAGNYGLLCFLPSVANGGAPHIMLGMTAQMTVN
jgi:hypothetical protein